METSTTYHYVKLVTNPFERYTGPLESQLRNNTVQDKSYFYDGRAAIYGTAFLVVKVLNVSEVQSSSSTIIYDKFTELNYRRGWVDVKKTMNSAPAALFLSLCFAPWDAARTSDKHWKPIRARNDAAATKNHRISPSAGCWSILGILHVQIVASFVSISVCLFEVKISVDYRPRSKRISSASVIIVNCRAAQKMP